MIAKIVPFRLHISTVHTYTYLCTCILCYKMCTLIRSQSFRFLKWLMMMMICAQDGCCWFHGTGVDCGFPHNEEYPSVANNDGTTRKKKCDDEEELLRRPLTFIRHNRAASNLSVEHKFSPGSEQGWK